MSIKGATLKEKYTGKPIAGSLQKIASPSPKILKTEIRTIKEGIKEHLNLELPAKVNQEEMSINNNPMWATVDQIERIRRDNNRLWMAILRLSLEKAPKRTKAILAEIKANDEAISRNMQELAK